MRDERELGNEVREFRLEGATLLVTVGVLLVALCGAFYLGRRVERASRPAPSSEARQAGDPLAHVAQSEAPADVDRSADFFDTGANKQAEPSREARRDREAPAAATPTPAAATPTPAEPSSQVVADGSFFVQIWAGRDRQAAELLVEKLQGDGYPVRVFSDQVEGDSLYKVRVGGFADEPAARKAADELESKGYRGAWVTAER